MATISLYSADAELLVHTVSAGFFILARLSPNGAFMPPLPVERTLALLVMRLAFELLSDFVVASVFSVLLPDRYAGATSRSRKLGTLLRLSVCMVSVAFVLDTQLFFIKFLCPYPTQFGETPLFSRG
eukprot:CAMPEP_0170301632 /NCGR_PEP_ID=MMETSP0116_2-20130129/51081_1 /TAXON_ID=400756 /ORGANISM="Durinskia baltica, Strain CSIRO CS-38" /LENGTH=126 /DNA_ID=CAMNT_0010553465 /DNA_START=1 /DNA_END=377 /DNA_ORIENTATION=-